MPCKQVRRPPHCKLCGHATKGHCKSTQGMKSCSQCPNGQCSSDGEGVNCHCDWHKQTNLLHENTTHVQYHLETVNYSHATEFILPEELFQYKLSIDGLTSNACTLIAMLTGLKFLLGELEIPSPDSPDDIERLLLIYRQIMIEGNTLHAIINPPAHQPNLTISDVLQCLNFPLTEAPFAAVHDVENLEYELVTSFDNSKGNTMHVLMVPPDKSMVILQSKRRAALLDSHIHKGKGGTILLGEQSHTQQFALSVQCILSRDWNASLEFANLSLLTLI